MSATLQNPQRTRRFRWQYSLRSLLILTLFAAIPASCIAKKKNESDTQDRILGDLRTCGCIIVKHPPANEWPGSLFGPDYAVETVEIGIDYEYDLNRNARLLQPDAPVLTPLVSESNTERVFELLPHVESVFRLYIRGARIDEGRARAVGHLRSLECLELDGCTVDEGAFPHLAAVSGLRVLVLSRTPLSENGIRSLEGADELECLALDFAREIPSGLIQALQRLRRLRSVRVGSCSPEDYDALRRALPHVRFQ